VRVAKPEARGGPRPEPEGPIPEPRPLTVRAQHRVDVGREQATEEVLEEGERRSLLGTMGGANQASIVVGELDRRVRSASTPSTSSSSGTGEGPKSADAAVTEVHDEHGNSGGESGGRGGGAMGGGAGGGSRGLPRLDTSAGVGPPIEMQRAARAVAVQQTAEQRLLAQKIVMARMENNEPVVLEKAMAQHASSVIGVILKKAYPDEKAREKDASKLVALILRSHGFYTYEHCTRLIDLASDLAAMTGRKDNETQRRLADGIMYKDLGEVEYLLSKGTPRQRQVITDYLAGQKMAQAGLLHDIGKIKIPKEILYKPGMLTPDEAKVMQMHPVYGAEILESIPPLAHAAPAARHHHERYDGKGYPDRLKGEQIPFEARVIAIVDTFDAMAADRPYRKGLPLEVCRSELVKGRGKQFDPQLVEAFMEVLDDKFVRNKMSMEDYKLGPGA
jgi:HD-GYP domain-containing protein (c-di-GMP phosphodiesterase class II)